MTEKRGIIINFISELEQRKVRYAIIRNYGFLADSGEFINHDLDILIDSNYLREVNNILSAMGNDALLLIDLHHDFIRELGVPYMGVEVFGRAILRNGAMTFSDEDTFVNIITHAVLTKNFIKKSYREQIIEYLGDQDIDLGYIRDYFIALFGDDCTKRIMACLNKKDFDKLLSMRRELIFKFVARDSASLISHLPFLLCNRLRNILNWMTNSKKGRLIALLGVDGSGKTTASEIIKDFFEDRLGQKCIVVYMGRGKNRALPGARASMGRLGIRLPKPDMIKKQNYLKKILFYAGRDAAYMIDSFSRYLLFIFFNRREGINVVTDRYAYDIMLNEATFAITRWLIINLYPRPDILIYLYNSLDVLVKRRREHSAEKLSEDIGILEDIVNEMKKKQENVFKIKTDDINRTSQIILESIR